MPWILFVPLSYARTQSAGKNQTLGLLLNEDHRSIVDSVKRLAVETPDDNWLDDKSLRVILSDQECAEILDHVRTVLVPDLDDMLWNWETNEQGESADGYYRPLINALTNYHAAFAKEGDAEAAQAFAAALTQVDERRTESLTWSSDEGDSSSPTPGRYPTPFQGESLPGASGSERSIFDDVDL